MNTNKEIIETLLNHMNEEQLRVLIFQLLEKGIKETRESYQPPTPETEKLPRPLVPFPLRIPKQWSEEIDTLISTPDSPFKRPGDFARAAIREYLNKMEGK